MAAARFRAVRWPWQPHHSGNHKPVGCAWNFLEFNNSQEYVQAHKPPPAGHLDAAAVILAACGGAAAEPASPGAWRLAGLRARYSDAMVK